MEIIDFTLHVNEYLVTLLDLFGLWTYVLLFIFIFAETGLVITPFLPGDSLLFAAGALSSGNLINIWILYPVLLVAAILGDTVNYWIGSYIGPKVFFRENSRVFKKSHLEKTREFFEKYGGKTIILARFVPIIRTFAPFVAGVGKMRYKTFLLYNLVGGFVWVSSLTFAGYFFGGLSFVKANFEYVIIGIIIISLMPMFVEYIKYRYGKHLTKKQLKQATYKNICETLEKKHLND